MNPERTRGFNPENKEAKVPPEAKEEKKTFQPDGREDLMREVYESNQSEVIDELAELKNEEDSVIFELTELSKAMLEASESDPKKVEDIAKRIDGMDRILKDISIKRRDLNGQLRDANEILHPFKGLTDEEVERSLHDITFGGIREEEAEKAIEPFKEIHEVTDDMIVGSADIEDGQLAKKDGVDVSTVEFKKEKGFDELVTEELTKMVKEGDKKRIEETPPPLPSKRKKKETPPPLPLDALVKAEMSREDRFPEELVPGARAASQAEYELTGDEFEIIEDADGKVPEMTAEMLDNELTALFEGSERMKKETESEVLPADSAQEREKHELGDESAIRNEVAILEEKVANMQKLGFSQKNLERLLKQKGVDPNKLAISGLYRTRVKMKSVFNPKLRLLLEIYDKKTAEMANMQSRIQTGKLRLEDPESYKKMMQDQRDRLRR